VRLQVQLRCERDRPKKPNAFKDYIHVDDTEFLKRKYLYGDNRYIRGKISDMKTSKSHQRINEARMSAEDMDELNRFKGDNYSLTLAQWERANPPDNDPFWAQAFNQQYSADDLRNPTKKVRALSSTLDVATKKAHPHVEEPQKKRMHSVLYNAEKYGESSFTLFKQNRG
jgi:hypothetical protein